MNETNVKIRVGNLFDSQAQTLVNTVNCEGVMGAGIALEFKKRFPEMYKEYKERCKRGEVKLGEPYCYPLKKLDMPSSTPRQLDYLEDRGGQQNTNPRHYSMIVNFPTKSHWKRNSKPEDIEKGLEHMEKHYGKWGITSLAIPALGCGNGGLKWRVMGPILYDYLRRLNIPVELYAPHDTPADELDESFLTRPVAEKQLTASP